MSETALKIGLDGFALPREAIVSKIAILGMSGSGKTQTARKLAEAMMDAGAHIVVLAPASGWWGLRSSADGAGPGFPIVVFGGDHGDAPLRPDSGAMMAAAVLKERFNAIFDMVLMSEAEMRRFATDFLGVINRRNRTPIHVFMDEFDIICPQGKSAGSEQSREAVNSTVRRGRINGIGSTMITQNPQDADKSALNMADVVIAMRMAGSQAIDAVKRWVERNGSKEDMQALVSRLPGLKTGTGWVWAPQLKILAETQFALCRTFDSSRTPSPGEHIEPPRVLAAVDMARLGAQIHKQAEEERENSPEYLKGELARVKAELSAARNSAASAPDAVTVQQGMTEQEREDVEMLRERLDTLAAEIEAIEARETVMRERLGRALDLCHDLVDVLSMPDDGNGISFGARAIERQATAIAADLQPATLPKPTATVKAAKPQARVHAAFPGSIDQSVGQEKKPGNVEERILAALTRFRSIGVINPQKIHVCLFSGYSHMNSKGFVNALGAMRGAGLIDYPEAGLVTLTDAGLQAAPVVEPIRGNTELHKRIETMLTGPEIRIFHIVVSAFPRRLARDYVMGEAGYGHANSKGFVNSLGRLRTLGFIDYPSRGELVATEQCFVKKSK